MLPGQAADHVGHRLVKAGGVPGLRAMAPQPAYLRGHVRRIEGHAADIADPGGGQPGDFRSRAPVHPDQARGDGVAGAIHRKAAVELAGQADGANRAPRLARGLERGRNRTRQRSLPPGRVLLGPAGPGITGLIGLESLTQQLESIAHDDGLETFASRYRTPYHSNRTNSREVTQARAARMPSAPGEVKPGKGRAPVLHYATSAQHSWVAGPSLLGWIGSCCLAHLSHRPESRA